MYIYMYIETFHFIPVSEKQRKAGLGLGIFGNIRKLKESRIFP